MAVYVVPVIVGSPSSCSCSGVKRDLFQRNKTNRLVQFFLNGCRAEQKTDDKQGAPKIIFGECYTRAVRQKARDFIVAVKVRSTPVCAPFRILSKSENSALREFQYDDGIYEVIQNFPTGVSVAVMKELSVTSNFRIPSELWQCRRNDR
jgi:hypothetical protein